MKTVHHSDAWRSMRDQTLSIGGDINALHISRQIVKFHTQHRRASAEGNKETVQRICAHIIHARNIRQSYHYAQTQADYPSN